MLDYSKYKYEQAQKQKAARKHQTQINVREIKFRPKIAQHDYDTKKGHVIRFLNGRDKVKVTIMFRGREMAHPERGEQLLNRLADELGELAVVEQRPQQDGRNMVMMLAPSKIARARTKRRRRGRATPARALSRAASRRPARPGRRCPPTSAPSRSRRRPSPLDRLPARPARPCARARRCGRLTLTSVATT